MRSATSSPRESRSQRPSVHRNDISFMSIDLHSDFDHELDRLPAADENSSDVLTRERERENSVRYEFRPTLVRRSLFPFGVNDFSFNEELISLTSSESIDSFEQTELKSSEDFFENLSKMPTLVDSSETLVSAKQQKKERRSADGKFVDPLTGEAIDSESTEDIVFDEALEENFVEVEESHEDDSDLLNLSVDSFSLEEIDKLYALAYKKFTTTTTAIYGENVMPQWEVQQEDLQNLTGKALVEVAKDDKIEKVIVKFFDDMINVIVRRDEEEEIKRKLKMKLDKKLLYKVFRNSLLQLFAENKVRAFLERKATEHFRRKGCRRQSIEIKIDESERYANVCQHLNELLGAEFAISQKTEKKIKELTDKLEEEEQNVKSSIEGFENIVHSTFKREDMPHLKREIDVSLRRMAELRKEISAVRSVLIQQQHTFGRLNEKIERLQDLGEGLHLSDYEALLTQVSELQKKIDDRINELTKLHYNFQNSVHALSHTKNKTEIVIQQVQVKISRFNVAMDDLIMCRKCLHALATKHNFITRRLKDYRLRIGLTDKPVLLSDYDETKKQIEAKKIVIDNLRKTRVELDAKIKSFEGKSKPTTEEVVDEKNVADDLMPALKVKGLMVAM